MPAPRKNDADRTAREGAAAGSNARRTHQRRGARLGRRAPVPPSIQEPPPEAAKTPTPSPKTKDEVDAFVRWEGEGGHPSHGPTAPPSRDITSPPPSPRPAARPRRGAR